MSVENLNWLSVGLPGLFLYLPLAVLMVLCALCLARLPGDRRRGLLPVAAVMAVCAAVLFGGAWLLGRFDLVWRWLPKVVLGGAIWGMGLASGILTTRYTLRWMKERRSRLALWGQALALYCLISVMGAGSILGGLWALDPNDETGTWQGRKVVQCTWSFMEDSYAVYEYRGPLVRGTDALAWSEEPMTAESGRRELEQAAKETARELGVSVSDGMVLEHSDSHGGFLGDGVTFTVLAFAQEDWERLEADMTGDYWHALPMTANMVRVIWSLALGENGDRLFPEVGQGYYYFRDRYSKSDDPADDSELFSRASKNFTMALYDSGNGMLYYFEFDS